MSYQTIDQKLNNFNQDHFQNLNHRKRKYEDN